jgi:hypothetical protein
VAKGASTRGGTSKVRLIVFEAEVADGDLSQITHVLQNAFKTASPAPRIIQATSSPAAIGNDGQGDAIEVEAESELLDSIVAPKARPSRKPRVAKTPTVMDDLDFASNPSLKDFVAEFDLSTAVDKYLVVALWFRDARSTPTVTVDHIYTAFRMLNWSTASNDFSKPLRNLRDEQSFKGGSREGWTLTLPGAGKIEAKKRDQ